MPRKRQNNFSNVASPHPMLLPTPACTLSLASSWDLCLVQDRVWLAVPPLCHPWQLHVSHAACAANPLTRRREEESAGLSLSVTSVWLDLPCGSYDDKMSFSNNHQETLKKKKKKICYFQDPELPLHTWGHTARLWGWERGE